MSALPSSGLVKSKSFLYLSRSVHVETDERRTLEELDGSEARLVLLDLPPMDVDRVSPSPSPSPILSFFAEPGRIDSLDVA
jgi:hypothetical protein